MQILKELITGIDQKLERSPTPVVLRLLLAFSVFLNALAALCRKENDENEAGEYNQLSISILKEIINLDASFGPAYAHMAYYLIEHHTQGK